jgi:hypothetical protein
MDTIIYDACDGYCGIYDACCDIYDACDGYCDIYASLSFLGIFGRQKQKKIKKLGQFVVRRGAGAQQSELKWLPE